MKRRLGVIVVIATALAAGTSAASALDGTKTTESRWACVAVQAINQGACLSNPLPERLPIPATPAVPV